MSGNRNRPGRNTSRARVSPARLVAYDVLRDVEERDAYANLALASRIRNAGLGGRDAALATELAAGTLRGRGRYDAVIELAAGRSIEDIDPRTRNVLRLGTHQILAMRTPAHAAVHESVELQRRVANSAAAGFVNGVLRAVSRSSGPEWDARITTEATDAVAALAARTSHPAWVVRALRDALHAEGRVDELEELLHADNAAPSVSLALLDHAGVDPEHAAARACDGSSETDARPRIRVSGPSPIGLEIASGDPAAVIAALRLPEESVRVQDQGSQLAALALLAAGNARPGEQWLDLCAGPGGKTALLASRAAERGAHLRANEVSPHRADLVRDALGPHRDAVELVSQDGRSDAAFGTGTQDDSPLFDRILVDAPCSGLGALRRRPEARWRKLAADLPALTQLQGELLDAAFAHLRPGGTLAYVTCSPHLAETRLVFEGALRRHPGARELDARAIVQHVAREPLDLAGAAPSAQLWPHRHGVDAMFIALATRAPEA